MKAPIFDIYKGTTNDGPGIRDSVFFKGCPLSCKWCHNPEGIDFKNRIWYEKRTCIGCGLCLESCVYNAISLTSGGVEISRNLCRMCAACADSCPTHSLSPIAKEWSVGDLVCEMLKDKEYFTVSGGGVTASGGEAMMYPEFLCSFFSQLKNFGIHTALDTTGFCDWNRLSEVLKYTDVVLYDLKVINPAYHKMWTGVDNAVILDNIVKTANYIKENHSLTLWIRTPIIPGFTDSEIVISDIADFIRNNLYKAVDRWELCAFNNSCTHKYLKLGKDWKLSGESLIKKDKMSRLLSIAAISGADEVVSSGITAE